MEYAHQTMHDYTIFSDSIDNTQAYVTHSFYLKKIMNL